MFSLEGKADFPHFLLVGGRVTESFLTLNLPSPGSVALGERKKARGEKVKTTWSDKGDTEIWTKAETAQEARKRELTSKEGARQGSGV